MLNKFFLLGLALSFSCNLQALNGKEQVPSDIHTVCNSNPLECLNVIPSYLENTAQKSRLWFQYKLYELDSLFQLAKFKELREKLVPWVDVENVPLKFRINAFIYYAKVLRAAEQMELSDIYIESAIDELKSITKDSADPMLVVQIANALNEQKKYQQGYDLLIDLERKYRHRDDPILKVELYGNLGHFTKQLGKLEQHIIHREEVLKWAMRHPDEMRITVAEYNLARAHQEVTNYAKAVNLFKQARITSLEKGNFYVAEMSLYRQAQIALKQKNEKKAIELMKSIDYTRIPDSLKSGLLDLNDRLGI